MNKLAFIITPHYDVFKIVSRKINPTLHAKPKSGVSLLFLLQYWSMNANLVSLLINLRMAVHVNVK